MTRPLTDELVFVALGGLGEIGMNAALYGFGPARRRKWLMVDCGVAFGGEELPGIDLVMPDMRFIEERRDDLVGLVITHAHEDHFGAIAELWPKLRCPVFLTPFAAGLLETRRLSEPGAPKVPLTIVKPGQKIDLQPFQVELINVAHSIPESNAVAIRTPAGLVVHTGDWKIDLTPKVGLPTDEKRLRELGEEGVLALVCDSTNAIRDGISPSETDVERSLAEIIRDAPARVAVTTFASNVGRIRSIAEAAAACGRQVVLAGRAMDRVAAVSDDLGLLDGLPEFLPPEQFAYLDRRKVVLILTGSQGEPRAALARVAEGEHPSIKLAKGDMVLFSSRAIPGNEKSINRIINGLVRQGVDVVTDRDRMIHVSGHPRRDELRMMYDWVKPRIVVPAHGEALHLKANADLARSVGVPAVITATNGDVVLLSGSEPGIVDEAHTGLVFKDGNLIVAGAEPTVQERRKLSFAGIVSIAIAIDRDGSIAGEPRIVLAGLPTRTRDGAPMEEIVTDAVDTMLSAMPKARRKDADGLEAAVERAVRSAVQNVWGKKPMCHAIVVEV